MHGQPSVLDSLRFEPVVTGLTKPVDADEFPPGSGRFLITQQEGLIRVFDGQELLEAPFLDLSNRISCCGEIGLLNVALHPRFDSNGLLYVHYTDSDMHTTVSRFSVGDNPDVAKPESELILLTLAQEDDHHKGGSLVARIGMETEFPLSPSGSVRRCVRTQAVRARSLCSGLFGRVGSP